MGQRRDRLDNRMRRQKAVRERNSVRKTKERQRRAARFAAKEQRLAAKLQGQAPAEIEAKPKAADQPEQ